MIVGIFPGNQGRTRLTANKFAANKITKPTFVGFKGEVTGVRKER